MANGKTNKPLTSVEASKIINDLKTEAENFNPAKELGKTRSLIAITFVKWYFYLLAGFLIFVVIYNPLVLWLGKELLILNPKDMILVYTSAIGSPLGFVVGYYFKDSEKNG